MSFVSLTASDGHQLQAYIARPSVTITGAVVVLQEIFGVNAHIRSVADRLAALGYLAVAPALYDRVELGVELQYEGEDRKRALDLMGRLELGTALLDVDAAFEEAQSAGRGVGVLGFCYGGLLGWLSATRGEEVKMRPDAVVSYYPGSIGKFANEEPSCPVMIQIGTSDTHIEPEQIEAVRKAHPEVQIFQYPGAEHGFNCDARAAYSPQAAGEAWARTRQFFETHLS